MRLSLGFSPCPNDTYIFYAMKHGKVDLRGLSFEYIIEDVGELNQLALNNEIDITKLSYHAYFKAIQTYILMNSGSALGYDCGPLLIAQREAVPFEKENISVAIPGENTTANLLLKVFYPHITNKKVMLFSEIEQAVLEKKVDAGLIIHENRFTFHQKGLKKLVDLGALWEQTYKSAIPLGGIAAKRSLGAKIHQNVNQIIFESVSYAQQHIEEAKPFIKSLAQEMDEQVMMSHINLYVNEFSYDLGEIGKKAIENLYNKAGFASKPMDKLALILPSN